MRVMLTMFPSTAHFLPVVPFAWALQAAGHDVCVATPPGYPTGVAVPDFPKAVNAAGLTAVSCGEPAPLSIHDQAYPGFAELLPSREESERYVEALGIDDPADRAIWDVFYHFGMLTMRDYHPPEPRPDVDALVEFARSWQPDLVLWEYWFPCGAVAARACGAAHGRLLIGPDYNGWAHERMSAGLAAAGGLPHLIEQAMAPLADRHGVELDDELLLGQWTVDPCLPGLRAPTSIPTVPARYIPYTGASIQQSWLLRPPERPRVGLTLGVSNRMFLKGDWGRTATLLAAVADLDIEVIATLNESQLLDVSGTIPPNVRAVDYVPLEQLAPSCSAMINHGAMGTFMVGAAKGVPQLICDTEEPTRLYGKATAGGIDWDFPCQRTLTSADIAGFVTTHRAGERLDHQTQSADEVRTRLRRVLEDPSYRAGAESVREQWLAAPSPAAIVPTLERLTAQHRRRGR